MRLRRAAGFLVLATLAHVATAFAQESLLARADSLFAGGEPAAAGRLYRAVLDADPNQSRAAFQLARLAAPGSREAVALYRRYIALEPQDPWGWLALGDALRDADRTDEAISAYERGLAGAPTEVAAWRSLGRERQRAGRMREAVAALERAQALEVERATADRLVYVRAHAAPAVETFAGGSRDSDANILLRAGVHADFQAGDRARVGVEASHGRAEDDLLSVDFDEAALTLAWRPRRSLSVTTTAGILHIDSGATETVPVARARLLYQVPAGGPIADVRFQHRPVTATALLLAREVTLTEARLRVDTPIAGPLVLRGLARAGTLDAPTGTNRRTALGGGVVWRAHSAVELGAIAQRFGYTDPTEEPYFAPSRADLLEGAMYAEFYAGSGNYVALDIGAGAQRVEDHDQAVGSWERALRLWSLASLALTTNVDLRLEAEVYDSAIGEAIAPEAGDMAAPRLDWRYGSAMIALRWKLVL